MDHTITPPHESKDAAADLDGLDPDALKAMVRELRSQRDALQRENTTLRNWMREQGRTAEGEDDKALGQVNALRAGWIEMSASLRESETRFRKLFEEMPVGVVFVDIETSRYTMVNPAYCRMLGYTAEELTRLKIEDVSHPEDMPKNAELFEKAISGDSPSYTMEKRYLTRDGRIVWGCLTGVVICDASGVPRFRAGMVRDITERKEAETALVRSEQRFRAVFEQAAAGIGIAYPDGTLMAVNRKLREILGYTEEELLELTIEDLTFAGDMARETAMVAKILAGKKDHFSIEKRFVRKDGELVWAYLFSNVVRDEAGNIRFAVGVINDITGRKQAEERLRESERRYRRLADYSTDIITEFDPSLRPIYVSPSVRKLTGYTEDEFLSLSLDQILTPESFKRAIRSHRSRKPGDHGAKVNEFEHVRKDGSTFWAENITLPIVDESGAVTGYLATTRDITDRLETMAALKEARRAAEAASRSKSELIANMSHELRTPLNAIIGYGQILLKDETLSADHAEKVVIMKQSGEHLLTVINDILDLARIEAGKMEIEPKPTDLHRLISTAVEMIRLQADRKGIKLSQTVHPSTPRRVLCDDKRLRQALLNLLSNAVKFTESGWVELLVRPVGDRIRFRVADTGSGIAEDQREAIFEPFHQTANVLTRESGTGLGLSITRSLVGLMGGRVHVESEVGEGSVFHFDIELPEVHDEPMPSEGEGTGWVVTGYPGRRRRVLVVDDESSNRKVIRDMLEPLGFSVREAVSEDEALDHFSRFHPDVVMTNLMIPDARGIDLIRRLRSEQTGDGPVIMVISGKVEPEVRELVREAGADDYLIKPVSLDAVLDRLKQRLGLKWVIEERRRARAAELPKDDADKPVAPPPTEDLQALYTLTRMGYVSGISAYVRKLAESDPETAGFRRAIERRLAEFDLETISQWIEQWMGDDP